LLQENHLRALWNIVDKDGAQEKNTTQNPQSCQADVLIVIEQVFEQDAPD
jgi:hypothetical protein